jgi:hypothetical protein
MKFKVGRLLRLRLDVGDQLGVDRAGVLDDGDADAALGRELGADGLVAGGVADDEVGAVVGEVLQDRRDVVVAGFLGDLDFEATGLSHRDEVVDPLLVPAAIGAAGWRNDRNFVDLLILGLYRCHKRRRQGNQKRHERGGSPTPK